MQEAARILVVEDDESTRELITQYLEDRGYEVSSASDGDQALLLLRSGSEFQLVLLDVILPGTGGLSVLESMQEYQIKCPVVLMTGWTPLQGRIQSLKLGEVELLQKPFTTDDLDRTLESVLSH